MVAFGVVKEVCFDSSILFLEDTTPRWDTGLANGVLLGLRFSFSPLSTFVSCTNYTSAHSKPIANGFHSGKSKQVIMLDSI